MDLFGAAAIWAFLGVTPTDDPLAGLSLPWTANLPWKRVVDVSTLPGNSPTEKLTAAQAKLVALGGGVAYFPPGVYAFADHVKLKSGVILRGAAPRPGAKATDDGYALETRFEFPPYRPTFDGAGTPIGTAFKGIYVEEPATAANVGVVHVDVNRGHIHFDDAGSEKQHQAGANRFVFGCVLRNTAVADPAVPSEKIGQKPWQRFTRRHFGAVDVRAGENAVVAQCRLPKSGDDDFVMNGYVLLDNKRKPIAVDGVVFDYDNRPGIYVNHYGIGGPGGQGPDGTPETHPHGFRKGGVIAGNYVYATGRTAIGFCGDGVRCENNVIRFAPEVWRPTATGLQMTMGSSTNDNRAVEMRGWRWLVAGNDYEVHRNWAFDKKYRINDGEGLMHEDHVNSTIKDSVLVGNKGNTYLSLYHTAGIDGLRIEKNEIRLSGGKASISSGAAIYASANRGKAKFPIRNVTIADNVTAGGGILVSGDPSEKVEIQGNRHEGPGPGPIRDTAGATLSGNVNYELLKK